jgi:GNAT superfamily N-acetyltransferase
MEIKQKVDDRPQGMKFFIEDNNKEVASGFLYLIYNQFHEEPYGLMEYVFVDPEYRKQGLGSELVNMIIEEAKNKNCYKLIAQCRYGKEKVHELYKKLGFNDHGKNFRMDLI